MKVLTARIDVLEITEQEGFATFQIIGSGQFPIKREKGKERKMITKIKQNKNGRDSFHILAQPAAIVPSLSLLLLLLHNPSACTRISPCNSLLKHVPVIIQLKS